MALPRKKVRQARQAKGIAKQEAKAAARVATITAKGAAKVKRIEAGKNLGARIGDALGDVAGAYGSAISAGAGSQVASFMGVGAPLPLDVPAPQAPSIAPLGGDGVAGLPMWAVLAGVALLGYAAFSGFSKA